MSSSAMPCMPKNARPNNQHVMWGLEVGEEWGQGWYLLLCAISQVKCNDMFESVPAKILGQDKLAAVASKSKKLPIIINNKAFYSKPSQDTQGSHAGRNEKGSLKKLINTKIFQNNGNHSEWSPFFHFFK